MSDQEPSEFDIRMLDAAIRDRAGVYDLDEEELRAILIQFEGRHSEPSREDAARGTGSYLVFDESTWPNPVDPDDVQWRLRYGTPTRSDLLVAASFMHAYAHLIELPQRERNRCVTKIRNAASTKSPAEAASQRG